MKKLMKLLLLASIVFVSGCKNSSGPVKNHFKEYTFVGMASAEQYTAIRDGLTKNALSLRSVTSSSESYRESGSMKITSSSESTSTICEDFSKPDLLIVKSTSSSKNNESGSGINLKSSSKSESTEWDAGNGYRYVVGKTTTNGKTEDSANAYALDASQSKTYKENRINSLASSSIGTSGSNIYVNDDGTFTIISSTIDKRVTAVQWGNEAKEYVTTSKYQAVYSISKDYYLRSYYVYQENKANRDPDTGEWFKSERIISNSYTSRKYVYGKRENKTIESLNKTIENKKFSLEVSLMVYNVPATSDGSSFVFDESGESYGPMSISAITTEGNIARYEFQQRISAPFTNYNSQTGNYDYNYYAQRYELQVSTLVGTNLTNEKYPLTVDSSTVVSSIYATVIQNNGKTYILNQSSGSRYFYISFTVNGKTAVINSISDY